MASLRPGTKHLTRLVPLPSEQTLARQRSNGILTFMRYSTGQRSAPFRSISRKGVVLAIVWFEQLEFLVSDAIFPRYMRCISSGTHRGFAGSYWPVVAINGYSPRRTAKIVDHWGACQCLNEGESGRWQLCVPDDRPAAEFVAV
jgi:hypothetical protein